GERGAVRHVGVQTLLAHADDGNQRQRDSANGHRDDQFDERHAAPRQHAMAVRNTTARRSNGVPNTTLSWTLSVAGEMSRADHSSRKPNGPAAVPALATHGPAASASRR